MLSGLVAGNALPAAAFGMDSNTGRLLPQPGSAGKSGSQEGSLGGGSDLLETPPLCSAPSQAWHAPGPSRLRAVATQPSSNDSGNKVRLNAAATQGLPDWAICVHTGMRRYVCCVTFLGVPLSALVAWSMQRSCSCSGITCSGIHPQIHHHVFGDMGVNESHAPGG